MGKTRGKALTKQEFEHACDTIISEYRKYPSRIAYNAMFMTKFKMGYEELRYLKQKYPDIANTKFMVLNSLWRERLIVNGLKGNYKEGFVKWLLQCGTMYVDEENVKGMQTQTEKEALENDHGNDLDLLVDEIKIGFDN